MVVLHGCPTTIHQLNRNTNKGDMKKGKKAEVRKKPVDLKDLSLTTLFKEYKRNCQMIRQCEINLGLIEEVIRGKEGDEALEKEESEKGEEGN